LEIKSDGDELWDEETDTNLLCAHRGQSVDVSVIAFLMRDWWVVVILTV